MSQPNAANLAAAEAVSGSQPQASNVETDNSKVIACYANFCRVTGTPEELVIDFGLNPHPVGTLAEPITVDQRVITNLFTARKLLQVLQLTIQRREATSGALETDVQRRVRRNWCGLFTAGRTKVARPCLSYANRLLAKHTLCTLNTRDLRPKFWRTNGLLDTAHQWRE